MSARFVLEGRSPIPGFTLIAVVAAFAGALSHPATYAAQEAAAAEKPRQLSLEFKPSKGDFDRMLERRRIRVLVPYSRTLYYVDKGRERGLAAELVRDFERYLNKKYASELGKRPLTVYIIVTTREKLATSIVSDGVGLRCAR